MKISHIVSSVSLFAAVCAAGSALADEHHGRILALGDSVVFGYITQAGYAYVNARNFVGYPDYLAGALEQDAVNASCPGETTGSFLSSSAPDNGCRQFRKAAPLHVPYAGTQLEFATAYLKKHHDVRLVTIGLGANDGFLFLAGCSATPNPQQCIAAGLPGALHAVGLNMATILGKLRATGYWGPIIIANYYSTDYSDAAGTGLTAALNNAIGAAATTYSAAVADVFTAFKSIASSPLVGGKTCHAGLLNVNPQNQADCDIHPSQSGQQLIAHTIEETYDGIH
jgi:lysophospholipase L1-like esterase